jgi:predicted phage terminase large subunit-like protein
MSREKRAMIARAVRADFGYFVRLVFQTLDPGARYHDNWHIQALAYQVLQAVNGEDRRLIVTMPPRNLKSIVTTVALSAYLLGCDPRRKIVCASYALELANKFALDVRKIMSSVWFRAAFPACKLVRNTESELVTTMGGGRFTSSVGGSLTGRGGSIVIIDDPMKAEDGMSADRRAAVIDWYGSTMSSRLNDKVNGTVILVMQRLHEGDLAGHLLGKPGWKHFSLPAIAPDDRAIPIGNGHVHHWKKGEALNPGLEPLEILAAQREILGSRAFAAQYLQSPASRDGQQINWTWFKRYDGIPEYQAHEVILSVDPAYKISEQHDYTVVTAWLRRGGGASNILIGLHRIRVEYPELRKLVLELGVKYRPDKILIEEKASGISLIQDLNAEHVPYTVVPINVVLDKQTRFAACTAQMEQGKVWLPNAAEWLETLQRELDAFPYGEHDDIVDSVSQYLNWSQVLGNRLTGQYELVGLYP